MSIIYLNYRASDGVEINKLLEKLEKTHERNNYNFSYYARSGKATADFAQHIIQRFGVDNLIISYDDMCSVLSIRRLRNILRSSSLKTVRLNYVEFYGTPTITKEKNTELLEALDGLENIKELYYNSAKTTVSFMASLFEQYLSGCRKIEINLHRLQKHHTYNDRVFLKNICENSTLEEITLQCTCYYDIDLLLIRQMLEGLENNKFIKKLTIQGRFVDPNNVTIDIAGQIIYLIENNMNIEHINLRIDNFHNKLFNAKRVAESYLKNNNDGGKLKTLLVLFHNLTVNL